MGVVYLSLSRDQWGLLEFSIGILDPSPGCLQIQGCFWRYPTPLRASGVMTKVDFNSLSPKLICKLVIMGTADALVLVAPGHQLYLWWLILVICDNDKSALPVLFYLIYLFLIKGMLMALTLFMACLLTLLCTAHLTTGDRSGTADALRSITRSNLPCPLRCAFLCLTAGKALKLTPGARGCDLFFQAPQSGRWSAAPCVIYGN